MAVLWGKCSACDLRFYAVGREENVTLRCPTCRQPADSKAGLFPNWGPPVRNAADQRIAGGHARS